MYVYIVCVDVSEAMLVLEWMIDSWVVIHKRCRGVDVRVATATVGLPADWDIYSDGSCVLEAVICRYVLLFMVDGRCLSV